MTVQDVLNLKLEDVKKATVVTLPKYKKFESVCNYFNSFERITPTDEIVKDLNSMGFPIPIENNDDLWVHLYTGKSEKGRGYFSFFYEVEFKEEGIRVRLESNCIAGSLKYKWGGWTFSIHKKVVGGKWEECLLIHRVKSDYFTK